MALHHRFILWLAAGFGAGFIPFAPGTFGSVVGLGWLALLLESGRWWVFWLGTLAGLAASVWLCDRGEKILGKKDPGAVVMDEIAAIPLCFASWLWLAHGSLPSASWCFSGSRWIWIVAGFALFRVFDILKPWPVRQSQSLPGGWGITVDDALAAVYVNIVMALIWAVI